MILWLPFTYCLVHSHNDDETQALRIALALQGMHRQASSASWHVLLSHRLEPKLRCMRSICYRRQGSRSETLFLVLSKVHKVTPCFMYMIAPDIVHHSSDCDTNELDEASRSVRTPHELRLRHCSLRKVAIRKKRKSAATLVLVLCESFDPN